MEECRPGAGDSPTTPKDILIYGFLGLLICLVFGFFIYYEASSVMYSQSLAELKRSVDASEAEFKVRMDQMMYGMTQAASEPHIKRAISSGDREMLVELMRLWKKERPYIDIWAFTDSRGGIIAMLGGEGSSPGELSINGVLKRAVQTGQAVMSVESVSPREIRIFGDYLEEKANRTGRVKDGHSYNGLVQVVAVPVAGDGGEMLGSIVTGIVLNENSELVNRVYRSQNVNYAVFLEEDCIAHKFEEDNSGRNLRIGPEASRSLFGSGQRYIGRENLGGTNHMVIYTPVKNMREQVIGAQLVALPEEKYRQLPGWIRNLSIIMGLFMGAIFFFITFNVKKLRALVEREKAYNSLLSSLRDFARRLQDCLTDKEICEAFVKYARARWDLSRVFVLLEDSHRSMVAAHPPASEGEKKVENFARERCKPFITGRPLVFNDREGDFHCSNGYVEEDRSYVCVPLIVGGRTVGVAHLESVTMNYWREDRLFELQSCIDYLAPALSNVRLLNLLEEKAFEDQLTGVKNRRFFDDYIVRQLQITKRQGQNLSILMMDIDLFKKFNDQYGHDAGDLVLKIFSKTVGDCLREADLLARYGGEEFVAVLANTGSESALLAAERIRTAVERLKLTRISMLGPPRITVSIGISTYPDHGEEAGELIKAADEALYTAKRNGRNRVCVPGGLD